MKKKTFNSKQAVLSKKNGKKGVINAAKAEAMVLVTVPGHRRSQATRVMDMLGVDAVVRLCIWTNTETNPHAATDEQLCALDEFIQPEVLCRMPMREGRGQIIYCKCNLALGEECILFSYQTVLDATFGMKCRCHARIYKRD